MPRNDGGDVYNATIGLGPFGPASVQLVTSTTINNLELNNQDLSLYDGNLSVLQNTAFNGSGPLTVLAVSIGSAATVDFGTVSQMADGTLRNMTLYADTDGGFDTKIGWKDAAISTIGSDAAIFLGSFGAASSSIRNTSDDTDALAGLQTNEGSFSISGLNFETAGNFSNTGGVLVAGDFQNGRMAINGALSQNVAGVLTAGAINVRAGFGGQALLEWQGAEINTVAVGASLTLNGSDASIKNSLTNTDALAGLNSIEGRFELTNRTFTTVGDFSVSGTVAVTAEYENATMSVSGTLAQKVSGTLTQGNIIISTNDTHASVLQWEGASIEEISSEAGIFLSGQNASLINSSDNSDALAGLRKNSGKLNLVNRNLSVDGSFMNSGTMSVGVGAAFSTGVADDFTNAADLTLFGTISTEGNLLLENGSSLTFGLYLNGPDPTFGNIVADGTSFLDGELDLKSLAFPLSGLISPSDAFEILTSGSIIGGFNNVADGGRIYLDTGDSFQVNIDVNSVTLSDFQAVPEPTSLGLIAIAGASIFFLGRKRMARTQS